MNPGYPPYPQQMPQPGSYPLYPPSSAASSTPSGQLGFNTGYPPQAGAYPPQPSGYPPQPSSYPPQPSPYPPQPSSYPPQPSSYAPQPQASGYPPQPSYPSQPQAPYQSSQPSYPPAPVSSYPPAPAASYPPAPASSYPSAPASSYPSAPASSYPSAPASSYPSAPASSYPSAPASSYPSAPASSYPSAPATSYPSASSSPYPVQPSQSSYPTASAPSYSQPAKSLYPTQPMKPANSASYPVQGSGAIQQSFVNQSYSSLSSSSHSTYSTMEQRTPTVKPVSPFNPQNDAEILRRAMKGFGTDEKAIINVLTKRSNQQRLDIAVNFKTMYGKDLIADLKSELSGKFEDLILALMKPLPEFLASEIHYAIDGLGTHEKTLVEILCTASNAEINAIKNAYQRLYGGSLENDLIGDTSGNFKRLLVSLVQGRRSENYGVDEAAAIRDAQALMSAGVLRFGTDESTFNAILCSRSYPQLRRVLMEYQRISGTPLEHAIKSEFSGDIEDGLVAIVKSVEDKAGFFAERLYDAVACVGTKDRQLIRVVVSRCEIDMQSIKQAYQQRYGKSLEQDIASDTSGDYKKTLLALIGGYY